MFAISVLFVSFLLLALVAALQAVLLRALLGAVSSMSLTVLGLHREHVGLVAFCLLTTAASAVACGLHAAWYLHFGN